MRETQTRHGLGHRLMALALSVLMVLTLLPGTAMAAGPATSGQCGDNVTWNFDEATGKLTLQGSGTTYYFNQFDNPVPWSDRLDEIRAVEIGAGITDLGDNLLANCTSLTEVSLTDTLLNIGENVFTDCRSMKEIALPPSLESVGNNAFSGCCIEDVTISDLGNYCRVYMNSMKSCPTAEGARLHCDGRLVTSLHIPQGVEYVNPYLFAGCSSLTSVVVPSSVTKIDAYAFANCENLQSITLPKELTSIVPTAVKGTAYETSNWDYMLYVEGVLVDNMGSLHYDDHRGAGNDRALPDIYFVQPGTRVIHNLWGYSMKTVVIPESVERIDPLAFGGHNVLDVYFTGDAPEFYDPGYNQGNNQFRNVIGTIYYPEHNTTWTKVINKNYDGDLTWVAYDPSQIPQEIKAPYLRCTHDTSGAPVLTWQSVPGAAKYEIWTQEGKGGSWKLWKTTTNTSVTDTDIQLTGDAAIYKVRGVQADGAYGTFSAEYSARRVFAQPEISVMVKNGHPVLTLPLYQVDENFHIYRSTNGGRSIKVWTADYEGTYEDTDVQPGNTYTYYVVASEGYRPEDDLLTSLPSEPVTVDLRTPQKLSAPELTVSNTASTGKPYLEWSVVPGAARYEIYYATSKTGTYKRLYGTPGNSVKHGSAKAGTTYYYKARSLDAAGHAGEFGPVQTRTCDLARPDVQLTTRSDGKPILTWKPIEGAQKYLIYYQDNSGGFERLTYVTGTKLTHGSAQPGHTYVYKVRALASKSAANSAWSYYDTIEVDATHLGVPAPLARSITSTGKIYLKWDAVPGADHYEVYCATSQAPDDYRRLISPHGTSIKHNSAQVGVTYHYKVRAVAADGSKGALSPVTVRTCDLERPDVRLVTHSGRPYLYWDSIPGAMKYEIYCSADGGSFSLLTSVKGTHLTHSSAKPGHTYRYRVKALHRKSSANSAYSYYDTITVK